ncbi:hypothetical protein K438DRAFT_1847433, partial [Mycena galopus ATCC 62051]
MQSDTIFRVSRGPTELLTRRTPSRPDTPYGTGDVWFTACAPEYIHFGAYHEM